MFKRLLFISLHNLYDFRFYKTYKSLLKSQWKSYKDLKCEQKKKLRKIIKFSYNNIPYYHKLFNKLKIQPNNIKRIKDLEQLPILKKETIKEKWGEFIPKKLDKIKYINRTTSGSTGSPLKYRITKFDRILHWAVMYASWGYANYKLGDKVVVLGGPSVMPSTQSKIKELVYRIFRNFVYLSSYDMEDSNIKKYVDIINNLKPKIGYGYAGAWYLLAKFIEKHNLKIYSPKAIFTSAEKLFPEMRKKIEDVLKTEVYDSYGLNDGGISAFECSEHKGLHINTERALLEVVDDNGKQLREGPGRILATSLYNYAMPFIRYDTGDLGYALDEFCPCGRGYRLLREVTGRQLEFLISPEGKKIYGGFFSHMLRDIGEVKEFQVVQEKVDEITIRINPEENFDKRQLQFIRKAVKKRSNNWKVKFEMSDEFEKTLAGKYKFIINNLGNNGE